eukprot:TRINITY_DN91590_c0_g1_i1.p1 TRINITY_DN91590_c0_g1~~TRINITY_DN91590_c0_g1_i1.p1  ORF type:complete len:601 (+),score=207.92 TRINITY_DN91590_c0_g1_i1:90-1892(+)
MARVEISHSSKELVDLSAEAVKSLGMHLEQIGGLIGGSKFPRSKGDRGAAARIKEKINVYRDYQLDVCRREEEIEARMAADFEKMTAWRKESGTEGANLIEELEAYIAKCRKLTAELEEEREITAALRQDVANLVELGHQKDRKWASLAEGFVKCKMDWKDDRFKRAGHSAWLQTSFQNIIFKFKQQMEQERLRLEHHRKMRKARAKARLDVIHREQENRMLQMCILAFQEETVENRAERHLEELRIRHEDAVLVYEGQIAQLLGDEEKAKQIVAEQVRRMEEARRKQREAEKQRDEYRKKMRQALKEKENAEKERDQALEAKETAQKERDEAVAAREQALRDLEATVKKAEVLENERDVAVQGLRKAEAEIKKKIKKIENLQRIIAELGAESDSDAPPDERAPPFFTNEDGSKAPRPRTRKERMGMAYREAESARIELRLGMAAMIDKDVNNHHHIDKLKNELARVKQEIHEVRWANQVLVEDCEKEAASLAAKSAAAGSQGGAEDTDGVYAALPGPPKVPLAASLAATTPFSPTRPAFIPASSDTESTPRTLAKTSSVPIMMPALSPDAPTMKGGDKISLAPLRKVNRPPQEWKVGWH